MTRVAALLVLLSIAGCQTSAAPPQPSSLRAVWCATSGPIRPSPEEFAAKSEAQKRKDLEHNKLGAKWCGWKP